jgi:hypothetical protein
MTYEDITAEVRLNEAGKGKAKAFADVTIAFGNDGGIKILGCPVYHDGNGKARVSRPARPGSSRYFEVVTLFGRIQVLVDQVILAEYFRKIGQAGD